MEQLYQERILALAKAIRGVAEIESPTHRASVSNPTCGDRVDVSLLVSDGVVDAASTHVRGCALCAAGAGLLVSLAPGLAAADIETQRDVLKAWLEGEDRDDLPAGMQDFQPVRAIRNRHKCVSLAYDACVAALRDSDRT
ncbi:MAG: iron-sulfur cluster assembly scaffold protein [Pseudomonadota bacterium]|nr:iron-sulfur cluster assembly scaffold protein [Pseudomonadota bacterium]